jgi:hypothetical protein
MARSTRDTTQSDGIAGGLLAGVLGASLLVYGALYVEPAWTFAQAEPRYQDVVRGKLGSMVEMDALTQALRASPLQGDLSRAAFVQMLSAQELGLTSLRAVMRLTVARRDLRRGLAASPADAFGWMRLAVTELRLNAAESAAKALGLALKMAPKEPKLAAMQIDLAVALWPHLDVRTKAALERRLNWVQTRPDLKAVAEGNSARVVRERLTAERSGP